MNSFIYGKKTGNNIFSSIVIRDYSYKVKEKEITKEIPEFYIEDIFDSEKVSLDFMALISLEELNSFDIDDEIYFNDYLISNELYIGFDNNYDNLDINDIDLYLTKIDNNYFNLRIEIPRYEIIIDNNFKVEVKDEEMPVCESK